MKKVNPLIISLVIAFTIVSCQSNSPLGNKVKEPFSTAKYESNNRFFRATGKGVSMKDNIARSKADIDAKNQLAGQVETTMRNLTDQYLADTQNENASQVADKFQSLTRQIMNTDLADLRKIGEQKYHDGEQYTVFVAYEIKKNAMFRFMKKRAKTDAKIQKEELEIMEAILDAGMTSDE